MLLFLLPWSLQAESVGPEEALRLLKEGNNRFVTGTLQHFRQDAARRAETAKGQSPYAAILGCADSRGALDILFDAGLGDLFTIRVAGNVADTDEIASLEYGAEHLHIPLIVVLGHTSCGAVTAVVKKSELGGQLPGLLDNLEAPAARAVAAYGSSAPDLVDRTAAENVLQSIQDMLTRSKILAELVERGELRVVGGLYHLDTGTIDWMESLPGLAGWVKAGLEGPKAAPPPSWVDRWGPSLATLAGCLVLLLVVQGLFVAEGRWVRSLKFRGRLVASFFGLGLSIGIGGAVTLSSSDLLPLTVALVCALVWAPIYATAHYKGFHRFYLDQKRKWEAAR